MLITHVHSKQVVLEVLLAHLMEISVCGFYDVTKTRKLAHIGQMVAGWIVDAPVIVHFGVVQGKHVYSMRMSHPQKQDVYSMGMKGQNL